MVSSLTLFLGRMDLKFHAFLPRDSHSLSTAALALWGLQGFRHWYWRMNHSVVAAGDCSCVCYVFVVFSSRPFVMLPHTTELRLLYSHC